MKKSFILKNLFLITGLSTSVQASLDESVDLLIAEQKKHFT